MAGYDRRDRIGHWVRKQQPADRHCTHACCRGYREHPSNWPVIPERRALRGATDEKLMSHYAKVSAREDDPKARRAELQILAELERRDRIETRRVERYAAQERHREAVAANRAVRRNEAEVERERIRVQAEAATRGYLVNRKGRARGIDPDEILMGRQAVFDRYASDEAKDYFAVNPRPTAAYFRGADTRYVERASAPRRRRRRVALPGGADGGQAGPLLPDAQVSERRRYVPPHVAAQVRVPGRR